MKSSKSLIDPVYLGPSFTVKLGFFLWLLGIRPRMDVSIYKLLYYTGKDSIGY